MILERIALHLQALQNGGCDCLFFAKRGQFGFLFFAGFSRVPCGGFGCGGFARAVGQFLFGLQTAAVGLFPALEQKQTFGMAQLIADFTISRGLSSLTHQLRQLAGKLFNHIIHTRQIGFRGLEL